MSDKSWHLVTKTIGGNVNILQNMTERLARETMQVIKDDSPYFKLMNCTISGYSPPVVFDDNTISRVWILGPEPKP